MRCRCCDNRKAKLWYGEYYCESCRNAIISVLKEDEDDHPKNNDCGDQFAESVPVVHSDWDEQ